MSGQGAGGAFQAPSLSIPGVSFQPGVPPTPETPTQRAIKAALQEQDLDPHSLLYKNKFVVDQELRRARALETQKDRRQDYLARVRCLEHAEGVADEDGFDDEFEVGTGKNRWRGKFKYFRNQLMNSEYMTERPTDFEDDWMMVPCPIGKRNLVIASGGKTRTYCKKGTLMQTFNSYFPGGNGKQRGSVYRDKTIIDTIFHDASNTFYILDMMCWGGQPIVNSDTEFRFYWMKTKIDEIPEVTREDKFQKCRFEPLPNFRCDKMNIEGLLRADFHIKLDGLLFYHKRTHYVLGTTPLALWLKPYMLPDLLGTRVPARFLADKPPQYTGKEQLYEKVAKERMKGLEDRSDLSERRRQNYVKEHGLHPDSTKENPMNIDGSGSGPQGPGAIQPGPTGYSKFVKGGTINTTNQN